MVAFMKNRHGIIKLAILLLIILVAWVETFFIEPGWNFHK